MRTEGYLFVALAMATLAPTALCFVVSFQVVLPVWSAMQSLLDKRESSRFNALFRHSTPVLTA
jgi:hypothetical protein